MWFLVKERELSALTAQKKGLSRADGPFVRSLDSALESFNVHRQAYYGGTFIGNHVHRTLKVLIHSLTMVVFDHC